MGGAPICSSISLLTVLLLLAAAGNEMVSGQGIFNNYISGAPEGVAGVDYPTLHVIPKRTGFTCRDRKPGFYADPATRCQAWHWCDTFLIRHSFLCPNLTVFNQAIRSCDWWYNVDCSLATSQYANNDELYRDPADDYEEPNSLVTTAHPPAHLLNVEVHTTPRAPPLAPHDPIHSSTSLQSDVNALPTNDLSTQFVAQEPTTTDGLFPQPKTLPPPFPPTPPPTFSAPTTPRPQNIFVPQRFNVPGGAIPISFPTARPTGRFGPDPQPPTTTLPPPPPTPRSHDNDQVVILAPQRAVFNVPGAVPISFPAATQPQPQQPQKSKFNFAGAFPIAFVTARNTGRFGPDPEPTTLSPLPVQPVQPQQTPATFARTGLTQGINLRRKLIARVRNLKQSRANSNGFSVVNTVSPTPEVPVQEVPAQQQFSQQPSPSPTLTSHVHFVAGNQPEPEQQQDISAATEFSSNNNNFNFEWTTSNALATEEAPTSEFNDLGLNQNQNEFQFQTTENEFTPPLQTEDATLLRQPATDPPPARTPKLLLLQPPPSQLAPTFFSHALTEAPVDKSTSFFNSGIPYGARLRPTAAPEVNFAPEANSNSLDNSGVFRRHNAASTTTPTAIKPQRNATKNIAQSPTTLIITSNASFRKRKLIGAGKVNTFPPFPVTTFSPKSSHFESTKHAKPQNVTGRRRKAPTAATVWFKIFPSSTASVAPSTTTAATTVITTSTTVAPPSSTTVLVRKLNVHKKQTSPVKKRRTFPSFPITTFKPRAIFPGKKSREESFGERDYSSTFQSTTFDDVTESSTDFSTTFGQ